MLNGLDLFTGIGGLTVALAGIVRPVAYCECDRYCQAILKSRIREGKLPDAPIWSDVRTLTESNLVLVTGLQTEKEDMAGVLKKLSKSQVNEAVQFYEAGMSLADLGHLFGITRQAMWDLMRRRTTLRPNLKWGPDNHFYRGGHRADKRAHDIMERAVRAGTLVNYGRCESCGYGGHFTDGRTAVQGHHDDYNEPLKVRWLCQKCHYDWHKSNKPIPFNGGGKGGPAVDIIYGGFP